MPIFVLENVFEIVIEIVIKIYMEQTQLFQCNRFHFADFRDWNHDWIFQNEQCSFWRILTEICKKSIIERTQLFSM